MDKSSLFEIIGVIVSMHRDKKLNDIEMYNTIIRCIYNYHEPNKNKLEKVVNWLEHEEKSGISQQDQFKIQNIRDGVGADYLDGFMALVPHDIYEQNIKDLEEFIK